MPKFSPEAIRTIALVGHGGAGKTTLAEALLAKSGAIQTAGSVEKGTTVCDFDPLEKQYQHSLNASVVHLEHQETRIHLVDTPGLPDFIGRAIGALPAVETAAVVVNAQNGIEMITSRMMQWAKQRDLCRMIIVNKIDAENVDLPGLLAKLQATFGKECLPINLPADGGRKVVDCFFNPSGDADFSSVEEAHSALVDQVVEVDEELMAAYLEKGEVAPEELHAPFEKALREGHLIPVCFVSARNGAGVAELLDVFVKLMPNPTEGNPPQMMKGEGDKAQPVRAEPDPKKHVLAHVFKVMIDPFVGQGRRLPRAPGNDHQGLAALHRRGQEGVQGRRTRTCCRARTSSRPTRSCPATSARWPRSRRSTSTPCSTIRTTRTTSISCRSSSRRPCTASRSSPSAAATSRRSPRPCTSSPPRTRRSASSTTPRSTRRS